MPYESCKIGEIGMEPLCKVRKDYRCKNLELTVDLVLDLRGLALRCGIHLPQTDASNAEGQATGQGIAEAGKLKEDGRSLHDDHGRGRGLTRQSVTGEQLRPCCRWTICDHWNPLEPPASLQPANLHRKKQNGV
eukprot:EG_transcript_2174